jgi:hypothetical protein
LTVTAYEYQAKLYQARSQLLAIKCDRAAFNLRCAQLRFIDFTSQSKFNPSQPRIAAGQPGGGQWTGGGGDVVRVSARGRSAISVRIGNISMSVTPNQAGRYAVASSQAQANLRAVRERDPTWNPRPSLTNPNSIESQISRLESEAREAQLRLAELSRNPSGHNGGPPLTPPRAGTGSPSVPPFEAIGSYRTFIGMPDLPSGIASSKQDGTVAFLELDGEPIFGVNSKSIGYTAADEAAAHAMRAKLIQLHPYVMSTGNIGFMPNDALFHAEATALMRAAGNRGGSLAGQTIRVQVDRPVCRSCENVLPLIGMQLGNPTVRFTDRAGKTSIMRSGQWQ